MPQLRQAALRKLESLLVEEDLDYRDVSEVLSGLQLVKGAQGIL